MKTYLEPGASGNVLATVAIGEHYLETWERNAFPTWSEYCRRHNLGLILFDHDIIAKNSPRWKKATWQKLLIGDALSKANLVVNNVCYLDSDILISPLAPNVFDNYDTGTIALVSQVNSLPQPLELTRRRLAFLRHTHLDSKYPLDSALFMTPKQIFEFHGLTAFDDYACAGFFVFNVGNHSDLLKGWFDNYRKDLQSITGGGDEAHFNYEVQKWGRISWLRYEFQALWTYEVAWRFPFLFEAQARHNAALVRQCIEASLYVNHFLHFAGSWNECQMWKTGGFFAGRKQRSELESYRAYLETQVTGNPVGIIKP